MIIFSFALVFALLVFFIFNKSKITEEEKELINRLKWQREVYGFEFYIYKTAYSLGVGKHRKNSTKEQDERWIRDRSDKAIKKNYTEWKKGKGL